IDALLQTAEFVAPHDPLAPATTDEETDLLAAWLSGGTVRLAAASSGWSVAARGPEAARVNWAARTRPQG
ncbi:MAG TPA: hypothetical protein VK065_02425, partial [Brevibacterium sp.]|nr:hypothetical protein [Brevibacterium sp.]